MKHHMLATLFALASLFASASTTTNSVEVGQTLVLNGTTNPSSGNVIIVAKAGSTLVLPAPSESGLAYVIYPHVVVQGGEVTIKTESGSNAYYRYRFVSGVRAVDGGSLKIEGADEISVDRLNIPANTEVMPSTGPLCDIENVNFTSGSGKLILKYNATVRRLPSCPVVADGSVPTTIALACANANAATALLDDGALCLTNFNVVALTANALPKGCHVKVSPGCTFKFNLGTLSADGLTLTTTSGSTGLFNIELLGRGATVRFANNSGKNIRCESNITGLGEILFKPDWGDVITRFRGMAYTASASSPISIPVDTASEPAPTESWKAKVSHWFDASDESTLVPFSFNPSVWDGNWVNAKNEFDGNQLVIGMKDKVEGSTVSLYNKRLWSTDGRFSASQYHLQVLPYMVKDGLNGKTYLSCGKRGVPSDGAKYDSNGNLISSTENRRLKFWSSTAIDGSTVPSGGYTKISASYAILVFGSQNGGGEAVIGTDGNQVSGNGSFVRKNGIGECWTTRDGFSMHADGLTVNPKNAKPNGGWQILSIDMSATNTLVNGLGPMDANANETDCGGQNYAEVIFFSEKPTTVERAACERYLAEKWGLESSYAQWDVPYAQLSGSSGTVTLYDDVNTSYDSVEEIAAEGSFSGTVIIPAEKTLLLDKPLPPTEADVPETNRVGWYDPDFAGAALSTNELPHSDLLWTLYGRTLTDLCNAGNDRMYASGGSSGSTMEQAKTKNFAPRMVTGVRGALTTGPSRKWLVFKEEYSDSLGNTIRTKKVSDGALASMSALESSVKQAFFVTDTSSGGGSVVSPNVNFNSGIIHRAANAPYTDPVWASGNTVQIAKTWLDTTEIDGMEIGYNGRPEVLSFSTVNGFKPSYIAWYQGGNAEILGEFIYYSEPLEDAARTKVQEYLMYKWFGDLNGKYADYSGATVTGAGTVKSPTLRNLPKFSNNFTGELTGGSRLEFNLGADGVADALAIGRELALEDGATVTVNVSGKPAAGHYTLLTATAISGSATLDVNGLPEGRRAVLHVETSEIWLEILSPGLMIIVR